MPPMNCDSHLSSADHRSSSSNLRLVFALIAAVFLAGASSLAAADRAGGVRSDGTGVTVAATGDIAAAGAKVVSDVILAHPAVSAVLLAGDTNNATPTPLETYHRLYAGTYDRFREKIFPAPGNHDRYSEPLFSAYRAFWGPAAHGPEMYYSFELGGWHIVSLDSYNYYSTGGAAAAAQLAWLKADLAANPRKPTLVYWHHPLFSRAKHDGNPKMKPFWDAIYAHGPALVVNGHNHVYERFGPLDPNGQLVAENRGIQQFQISPGGAAPVDTQNSTEGPAPAKFHGDAYHVGFFTLHSDGGYRYTINSVDRSGATAVVDTGAGNLLGGPNPRRASTPSAASISPGAP